MGVGTSTLSYKFQVEGGRALVTPSSEAYAVGLRYNSSTNGVWLGSPSANAFQISNFGGTAYLNIDNGGNVGIGNSSPSGRLSVLPPTNPTTVATSTTFTIGEVTNNPAYQLRMSYSNLSSVLTGVIDSVQNSLGAPLAINPTGGNVGVGTSSPGYKLDVTGSIRVTNNNYLYGNNSVGTASKLIGRASNDTLYIGDTGFDNPTVLQTGNNYLSFIANGSEPMRILSGGNVGIGTITPTAKLQVVGGAIMPATGNTSSSGILFPPDPGGGTGDSAWIRNYAVTSENTVLELGTSNDTTDNIALMPSGNVGIGTTSPAVKLAIVGTDAVLLPVGNTVQRPTGANGYIRYNSQTTSFEGYSGGALGSIGGGATGAGGDQIFYENGQTVNNSYTIATGKNAGTFGPVTIATGAVVTVPTGSVWSIV
jgi:hypothetical protein